MPYFFFIRHYTIKENKKFRNHMAWTVKRSSQMKTKNTSNQRHMAWPEILCYNLLTLHIFHKTLLNSLTMHDKENSTDDIPMIYLYFIIVFII